MKTLWLYLTMLGFTAAWLNCSPLGGGVGSEAEAKVMLRGRIVDGVSGLPAANTQVKLLPADHDPVESTAPALFDTTDDQGEYGFEVAKAGSYVVSGVQLSVLTRCAISGIEVARDPVDIPIGFLRAPGAVRVKVISSMNNEYGYIYIPGTAISLLLAGNSGVVVFDSVPAGVVPQIRYAVIASTAASEKIAGRVEVRSNDTTAVEYPGFVNSQKLALNTSSRGANVAGTVINFPVLVRLTKDNFDFSSAKTGGADIRFTKWDGAPLFFEIEQWDEALQTAAVWVRVDTVHGNDSTQSIVMLWGDASAASASNGAMVFDTANGFQGVWHLSGDGAADPVLDATINGYNGISPDTARPQVAEGVVGKGRVFNGVKDYVTMPNTANSKLNFPVNGYYTISAWVEAESLDGVSHLIVAKGYEQYFLRLTYFPSNSPLWEFSEFGTTGYWNACTTAATSKQWVHVAGVRQGNRQLLYCNGVVVDSTPDTYQNGSLSRNTSYDLSIGKFLEEVTLPNNNEGYCFFKGSIDEVRILNAARSSDWVRLCYMNQRADDRLVVFK